MPQRIGGVLSQLLLDPSIGKAIPRIPGNAVREVDCSRDISTLGAQGGFIFVGASPNTNSSIETLFVVHEKLQALLKDSVIVPGLFTQVLGIRNWAEFKRMADRIREIRNRTARPTSFRLLEGDANFSLIPRQYQVFARISVTWNEPLRA
jgi:dihydroorotase-like cyclic amidohydrolase